MHRPKNRIRMISPHARTRRGSQTPPSLSDPLDLIGLHHRICLSDLIPPQALEVELASVLLRVPVGPAECRSASALEAREEDDGCDAAADDDGGARDWLRTNLAEEDCCSLSCKSR
ncbi:uncharacterized protein G2W53_021391 [Senna tora]|uniref:Uncharacterized protein n=1 Tax=Senna tora TaxID=362788 RepID=A0A834TL00_9FABA|nr:uncharacterized protein G2W53_021391 [Senna tora]